MATKNSETEKIEPDISGKGNDFLDTIQILQNKEIQDGYLEAKLHFSFSAAFSYPVVFRLQSTGMMTATTALAFDISQSDKTKQRVEEKFIVPQVCKKVTRDSILHYLASIVEKDIPFALFLHRKQLAYGKLTFYPLTDTQKIVFSEHLVMKIIEIVDKRKKSERQTDHDYLA
jgi:hypothetical protein